MKDRFNRWNEAIAKPKLPIEVEETVAVRRERAKQKVDAGLGIPSRLRVGVFTALAVLFGAGFGFMPWLVVLATGLDPLKALLCAAAHTLIAYALQLMARRHGVSDRGYWLWTLLGALGLLVGWLVMRRSQRNKYFQNRRLQLMEEELSKQS